MRMGRLIARLSFERAGISPPGRTARLDAGDAGNCRRRSAGPGFSIARAGPRVAIPSRRPRKVAIVTFKFDVAPFLLLRLSF